MGQTGQANKITAIACPNAQRLLFADSTRLSQERIRKSQINRICYNCSLTSPTANPMRQRSLRCALYSGHIPCAFPQLCRSNPRYGQR